MTDIDLQQEEEAAAAYKAQLRDAELGHLLGTMNLTGVLSPERESSIRKSRKETYTISGHSPSSGLPTRVSTATR